MRKLGIVALGAAAALTLAGCATSGGTGASDDGAEIRVWLVGTDTPDEAREYLVDTFEKENPGSTLVIEEQAWDGLVDRLTTSLSGSDSPDVVEVGNTQASAFTSAGAFLDLTDEYETLGGDDLLPGFVEAGSYDGKFYAAPLYSGSRLVFYKKDALAAAGLTVPTTLDEYISNAQALAAANPGKSGIWWPGQDWYNALPYIWENGGEIAVADGEEWDAQLSSEESLAGLAQVQEVMTTASSAPKDGNETSPEVGFCDGTSLQISAPSWVKWSILAPADAEAPGCPDQEENLGVYALPGMDGGAAQVFAGGSNIGISAKSAHPELALSALEIILSDEFQTIYGENGLVPAKLSLADTLGTDEVAQAIAAAAGNAKLTPASPNWADVEASGILTDLFVNIAQGGDITALAEAADEEIEAILNS
ncbi:carbohydrate ABC transporter substrate-binding protein (CUT1 family) [Agromyces ramosus]|jgi:N,N'-diacetylchitobiose transport system substrate-binding protein|uniref:Carbohydrate ABC transporter substrate-binding protein (CUT1 family) n=1 Tax=Agromyces ramosus TaxID=33879 RepID=A0A4Q7MBS2_9MICO|nr:extracellular solute-binding protein [Agromyces ramosus]RZS64162.1 carbohydrate ABC transporter substrate-binding protein (CUT1 family) [Agromyces ramosus]